MPCPSRCVSPVGLSYYTFIISWTILLFALVPSRAALGDEVLLINGDRLTGDVVERTRESIVLEHAALGRINVPIDSIRLVRTKKTLLPRTPDAPSVPVVPPDEDGKPDASTDRDTDADDAPAGDPSDADAPAAEDDADAEWSSQFEIGLNATAGTSETKRLRTSFQTTRSSPINTFRYDATYRFGEDRGTRTQNSLTTGVFTEWPYPDSPWSMFLQGRYDYSEFQSWDHRISSGIGAGYQLFDVSRLNDDNEEVPVFNLKLRGGAGLRKEFGSIEEPFDPEGIAGFELGWRINDSMRLEGGATAFPSLVSMHEFRVISSVDWIIDIDWASGMALKLGAAHEYESETDPGVSKHDLSVYGTLLISF